MKTLIVYDSIYGNTQKVAEAIGGVVGGEIRVVKVCETKVEDLKKIDLLIVGSPTHGGRPTEAIKNFLSNIPENGLKGVRVAAFDTSILARGQSLFLKTIIKIFGYAGKHILADLEGKGGIAVGFTSFMVTGKSGPLVSGELDRAKKWAKEVFGNGGK